MVQATLTGSENLKSFDFVITGSISVLLPRMEYEQQQKGNFIIRIHMPLQDSMSAPATITSTFGLAKDMLKRL